MRKLLLWLFVLVAVPSAAQVPTDDQILAVEQALFDALTARDRGALDALIAPDYVLRGSPDVAREEWVRNAVSLCWGEATIERFEVRATEMAAVASFELTFDRDPTTCQPATLRSLITDVWQRRGDRWQLVVRHSGPTGAGLGLAAQFGIVPQAPPMFEARAELSFVATGGNASTRTLGVTADLAHRGRGTTTAGRISFVRSEADDVENARALTVQARQGWRITARTEGFARGEYLRDLFAGVEHRGTAEGGISYAPSGPPHALRVDLGIGPTNEVRLGAADRRFASTTGAVTYRWIAAPLAELSIQSSITSDLQRGSNWRSASAASALVSVTRLLSTRVAYSVRYLNEPVPGFRRTDTTASAALVLSYARRR